MTTQTLVRDLYPSRLRDRAEMLERREPVVRGTAEDFCLVVTQRRHVDDTSLAISGEAARVWMVRAQVFAGPPTAGPNAGRF